MFRATTSGSATSEGTTRAESTSTLIPTSTRTIGSSPGMRWPSRSSYCNMRSLNILAFWFFWEETFKDTFLFYKIHHKDLTGTTCLRCWTTCSPTPRRRSFTSLVTPWDPQHSWWPNPLCILFNIAFTMCANFNTSWDIQLSWWLNPL